MLVEIVFVTVSVYHRSENFAYFFAIILDTVCFDFGKIIRFVQYGYPKQRLTILF